MDFFSDFEGKKTKKNRQMICNIVLFEILNIIKIDLYQTFNPEYCTTLPNCPYSGHPNENRFPRISIIILKSVPAETFFTGGPLNDIWNRKQFKDGKS